MGSCCSSEKPKKHKKKHKKATPKKGEDECCGSCFGSCCAGGSCECCGCCGCCGCEGEEKAINTGRILTLESMGFDDDGNLRHGFNRRDCLGEMQLIIGAEQRTRKRETKWAIVDATWLYQWLAYVHSKDEIMPLPGPCHNFRLVHQNEDGTYRPRIGLVMEKNGKMGDYRKISIKSWEILKELYPGSSPDITATFEYYDTDKGEIDPHAEDGYYSTESWEISGMKKRKKSVVSLFERFGIGHAPLFKKEVTETEENKGDVKEGEAGDGDKEDDHDHHDETVEKALSALDQGDEVSTKETLVESAKEGGGETSEGPHTSEDVEGTGAERAVEEVPAAPEDEKLLQRGDQAQSISDGEPSKEEEGTSIVPGTATRTERDGSFYDSVFSRHSQEEEGNL